QGSLDVVGEGLLATGGGGGGGLLHWFVCPVYLPRDVRGARKPPPRLYLGHVQVKSPSARLEHDEHAPLILAEGTYRIRRQRELEPTEVGLYDADFDTRKD